MFKHFFIGLLFLVIIYVIVSWILFLFHKIYFYPDNPKYKMNTHDREYLKMYSTLKSMSEIQTKSIFYTDYPWSSKNNNYIHHIPSDTYYLIDKGYYYYIPSDEYSINIHKDKKVWILHSDSKVIFL